MPNYNYRSQFKYSFAAKPVSLIMQVNFGASGAPTIVSGTGMGIASIVRNSAGDYTISLGRAYGALMGLHKTNISSSAPAAPSMYVKSNLVASAGTIEIVMNSAGTATDPASGESALLEIVLNDSSLPF